jgi:hypothetical protein
MQEAKAPRTQDNQAEVRNTGHVDSQADVYIQMADGESISRSTNFGIEHYGFVKDSEGLNQTK